MIRYFDDRELLDALRKGAERSSDIIAKITDYHGGALTTEYMLTSDIARELIEQNFEVRVECLNRYLVNALVKKAAADPSSLGSQRTDVAVLGSALVPAALIEVKIDVRTLRKIRPDLVKIASTISMLKFSFVKGVIGASIFQVHVQGNDRRWKRSHLKSDIEKIEKSLRDDLIAHARENVDFSFSMHPLQAEDAGIVERDVEDHGNGSEWGVHGHATRFYAVLIRSTAVPAPPPPDETELEALRRQANE
jgi:hypothetical protein